MYKMIEGMNYRRPYHKPYDRTQFKRRTEWEMEQEYSDLEKIAIEKEREVEKDEKNNDEI